MIIKCNVLRSRKTCITIQAFNVQDIFGKFHNLLHDSCIWIYFQYIHYRYTSLLLYTSYLSILCRQVKYSPLYIYKYLLCRHVLKPCNFIMPTCSLTKQWSRDAIKKSWIHKKNVELYGYLSTLSTTRNLLYELNLGHLCKLSKLLEDMEPMSI